MNDKVFVKNVVDEEQIQEAERKERFEENQFKEDLKELMELPSGRRVFWKLLGWCGLDRISVDYDNSNWTYFREGHRNLGLQIKGELIEASLENYQLMELEALKREGSHVRSKRSR